MKDALFDSVARFYDIEIQGLALVKNDVPFFLEYARLCKGEVLELACGTGRALIPLAQQGITVTGLDASKGMLDQAQKKITALPQDVQNRIHLTQQDMTAFDLGKKFSLIFCTFRSFQHLVTRQEQEACLTQAKKHLADDGIFIIHLFVPLHHLLAQRKRSLYLGTFQDPQTGRTIARRSEVDYDLAKQVLHEDRFYEWTDKQGKLHRHTWSFDFAFLFRYEAELLMEKHGFTVEDVFGDFDKSAYNYYSGEQIFVLKRV